MATIFDKDEKLRQFLEGTASQEVKEEVLAWAASDPDHQAQLDELESLWEQAAGSAVYREIDSHADWHKVRQRLQASDSAPSGGSSSSSTAARRRVWALAASVLLLATLFLFFYPDSGTSPDIRIVETGLTSSSLALPDGSKVTLRPHSRIKYPMQFAEGERRVELQAGSAFFDVERNPQKPFIIEAGPSLVEVKGTSFTVHRQGESTKVAVKTGKVRFYLPDHATADVMLSPGQQAELSPKTTRPALSTNSENQFSWATNQLVFDQTPIQQVLDDLSAHFGKKFEAGPLLDTTKALTSEFAGQGMEEVLEEMKTVMKIRYRIETDKVVVE